MASMFDLSWLERLRSLRDYNSHALLLLEAPLEEESKVVRFIISFNQVWSQLQYESSDLKKWKITKVDEETPILFSSCKGCVWLSNFFHTIIYDPQHRRIYAHVESGYVAFKASLVHRSEEEISEIIKQFDPKEAKRMGWDFFPDYDFENPFQQNLLEEMHRLVYLKFQQNLFIQNFLKNTGSRRLQEFTANLFWGTGLESGLGLNHLGRILERVRDAFKEEVIVPSNTRTTHKKGCK